MIKQKLFASLRVKFVVTMAFAFGLSVVVFFFLHWGIDYIVQTRYMSESAIDKREEEYIESLQNHIKRNELSSKDTASITQWVKNQSYIYLVIYKDSELFYDSEDAKEEEEDAGKSSDDIDGTLLPTGAPEPEPTPKPEDPDDDKKDISQYFDPDARLFPIELSDGTLFASVAEFTQEFYYSMSYVISIVVSVLLFAVIMILFFDRTTIRIKRLASAVRRIERNNDSPDIVIGGRDEIAGLANDVNKMKNSIFDRMQKEQDAWRANTELITAMSHDIRNPLTVLLGYLDVMEMQAEEDSAVSDYIGPCKETALKIKKLSDDMFQYFLVFGKKEIDMSIQEYDAVMLLTQVLSEHMLLMSENGYVFESKMLEEPCTILVDATAFVRVVDNLFSNLKKYADKDKPITLIAEKHDDELVLEIKNTIIQNDVESNGIGLKTCAKIMNAMNAGFISGADDDIFSVKITLAVKKE